MVAPHTRALRAEFLRWALVSGRSVDADAAAVATAVLDPMGREPVVLTDDLLTEVVWIDAALWCDDHAVDLPAEFASTLHALIDFSAAALLVHPNSDTVDHLHSAIVEAGAPTPRHGCRPLPTA